MVSKEPPKLQEKVRFLPGLLGGIVLAETHLSCKQEFGVRLPVPPRHGSVPQLVEEQP